jgi:hypothetical protein
MSNPADKTKLQRLIEERDATLAYLAICKAAEASVDEALQRNTKEHLNDTLQDNERVISSLSELIGTSTWQPNRHSQANKTDRTSSRVDGDTATPSQHSNLAHR